MADVIDVRLAILEIAWAIVEKTHVPAEIKDEGLKKLTERFNTTYNEISSNVFPLGGASTSKPNTTTSSR